MADLMAVMALYLTFSLSFFAVTSNVTLFLAVVAFNSLL